ncbi:hypothetical protein SERLA73DRAFT_154404 [Serpula lacrymans var. lacrymans S7.3]|uniref:Uncharacterized protein n=2 Tax=Serpula lacrymans var. lacrymans TaxID=341189 RepID=F8Q4K4_SERL3|nr:uncharacterized protein SERLADRAFT_410085 [Serpula lacrymans var. lacrymans S7.9]EGN97059.1 hypothetical protein SERLA73DRAFT_154404 [Serpula lacrymans var. lacrymans S7.3]EGO22655.1 hypothetical protein SERLADRAFT_410085 [Serpula lacrymans var. lacrymans S7.9]
MASSVVLPNSIAQLIRDIQALDIKSTEKLEVMWGLLDRWVPGAKLRARYLEHADIIKRGALLALSALKDVQPDSDRKGKHKETSAVHTEKHKALVPYEVPNSPRESFDRLATGLLPPAIDLNHELTQQEVEEMTSEELQAAEAHYNSYCDLLANHIHRLRSCQSQQ